MQTMVKIIHMYHIDNYTDPNQQFSAPFKAGNSTQAQTCYIAYIIPDILSPKTTRAFWRQNNFNINKPAPLGAKLLGAFHWKCSTPFYS